MFTGDHERKGAMYDDKSSHFYEYRGIFPLHIGPRDLLRKV